MKPLMLHPEAESEAFVAAEWYEAQRTGLGSQFRHELEAALNRIQDNPQLYAVDIDPYRACPLHRFPFTLYYFEMTSCTVVFAVAHQRRRPGYWQERTMEHL